MENINEPIDVESRVIEEEEHYEPIKPDEDILLCKGAVPLYVSIVEKKDDKGEVVDTIAVTTYLCKGDKEPLFVMNRVYSCKDELERASFECLPYAQYETDFVSRKIEANWIKKDLNSYTTNFQFYLPEGFEKEKSPIVYTYGIAISDKHKQKIVMNIDTFSSLLFLDKYPVTDASDNDHDLATAVVNSANIKDVNTELFVPTDLKILSIADATIQDEPLGFIEKLKAKFSKYEKVSTNIAAVVKFEKPLTNGDKEYNTLLMGLDIGVVFDNDKFKGKTIEDIENSYFTDIDEYVSSFMIPDTKIYGIDKEYTVIRATNKNKDIKVFLLDKSISEEINNKINDF